MKEKNQPHPLLSKLVSIFAGIAWLIFILLFTFFWSTDFTFFQNAIITVVSFLILGAIIGLVWKKWGFKKGKSTPPESLEDALEKALKTKREATRVLLDLTDIKGIGPKSVKKLKAVGIRNVFDLADSSANEVSKKTGIPQMNISKWIEQARKLVE